MGRFTHKCTYLRWTPVHSADVFRALRFSEVPTVKNVGHGLQHLHYTPEFQVHDETVSNSTSKVWNKSVFSLHGQFGTKKYLKNEAFWVQKASYKCLNFKVCKTCRNFEILATFTFWEILGVLEILAFPPFSTKILQLSINIVFSDLSLRYIIAYIIEENLQCQICRKKQGAQCECVLRMQDEEDARNLKGISKAHVGWPWQSWLQSAACFWELRCF